MSEEALIELLKSAGVPDEKISSIVEEMREIQEEQKTPNMVYKGNEIEQAIALMDLQMMIEPDWRKRAQIAAKRISLRLGVDN